MSHLSFLPAQVTCAVRISEWVVERVRFADFISGPAFFVRLVPVLFGVTAYLASQHTLTTDAVAAMWPANGVLLAGLLLASDHRTRLHTLACCAGANVFVNVVLGYPAAACLGFPLINTGEALLAYLLLAKLGATKPERIDARQILTFTLAAAGAALPAALSGGLLAAQVFGTDPISAVKTWFMADTLGLLVIAPAFALAFHRDLALGAAVRLPRQFALYAILLASCALAFAQETLPVTFVVLPAGIAIAFQLGVRASALATLIITTVAIVATSRGWGAMALAQDVDQSTKIWLVQVFCLVNHFTTMFVAAAVSQRDVMQMRIAALSRKEAESREHLEVALDAMTQGLCLFDRSARIVAFNTQFLEIYRLRRGQVSVGMSFQDLAVQCVAAGTMPKSALHQVLLLTDGDTDQHLSDGRIIRISQRRVPSRGLVCTYSDVTAERSMADELRYDSMHDPLTSLSNRRHFIGVLSQELALRGRGKTLALMYIDIDHFKDVNDRLGHHAGDTLLRTVGDRLRQCVRDSDLVARLGGDEFAVLLRDADDEVTCDIARRMVRLARQPIFIEGLVTIVSLSIGVAQGSAAGNAQELLEEADAALYKVKQGGRNGYAMYRAEDTSHLDQVVA